MNTAQFKQLLEAFKKGKVDITAVLEAIKQLGLENLKFAQIDHQRALRQGFPEVVFCQGKETRQVMEITRRILARDGKFLGTHASLSLYQSLKKEFPELRYHQRARCIHSSFPEEIPGTHEIVGVITAGTSDIPVAEEAVVTLRMFGYVPLTIYDVGVAGLHRLNHHWKQIQKTYILIVIAGMEGALPSVMGGLTDRPIIAVPTSVGYGTHLKGLTALLAMMNSCANNVTVVNIDNGFGAGFIAALFVNQLRRYRANQNTSTSG